MKAVNNLLLMVVELIILIAVLAGVTNPEIFCNNRVSENNGTTRQPVKDPRSKWSEHGITFGTSIFRRHIMVQKFNIEKWCFLPRYYAF